RLAKDLLLNAAQAPRFPRFLRIAASTVNDLDDEAANLERVIGRKLERRIDNRLRPRQPFEVRDLLLRARRLAELAQRGGRYRGNRRCRRGWTAPFSPA